MNTIRIAAISFVWIILSGSQSSLQAKPTYTPPGEGSACSANGQKGTIVIESGNGHAWCKVGDRETECGGSPDQCTYGYVVTPKVRPVLTNSNPQFNNSTPMNK
jgi:hypothetical protein